MTKIPILIHAPGILGYNQAISRGLNRMNPTIIAAIIGVAGVVVGAVLKELLPNWLSPGRPKGHSLLGDWDSAWGPFPNGPLTKHETLTIYRQRGLRIEGTSTWAEQPDKKWKVEGRYDGNFLQMYYYMYYYPSADSKDPDFLDYGCYFLKRKAAGNFEGYQQDLALMRRSRRKESRLITT